MSNYRSKSVQKCHKEYIKGRKCMYLTGNSGYLRITTPQESFSPPYISKPISDDFTATSDRKPANRVRPDCSVMVAVML